MERSRCEALADLKSGVVDTLVATDVASRGLHISRLRHVVNYERLGSAARGQAALHLSMLANGTVRHGPPRRTCRRRCLHGEGLRCHSSLLHDAWCRVGARHTCMPTSHIRYKFASYGRPVASDS